MNKNKLIYEAPEAQTFVVRFEGNIMSPVFSSTHRTEVLTDDGEEDF